MGMSINDSRHEVFSFGIYGLYIGGGKIFPYSSDDSIFYQYIGIFQSSIGYCQDGGIFDQDTPFGVCPL